jgi:hypothetical protein
MVQMLFDIQMLLALALLGVLVSGTTIRIPAEGEELEDPELEIDVEAPPLNNDRYVQMLDEAVTEGLSPQVRVSASHLAKLGSRACALHLAIKSCAGLTGNGEMPMEGRVTRGQFSTRFLAL